jgi:hypothetical protein
MTWLPITQARINTSKIGFHTFSNSKVSLQIHLLSLPIHRSQNPSQHYRIASNIKEGKEEGAKREFIMLYFLINLNEDSLYHNWLFWSPNTQGKKTCIGSLKSMYPKVPNCVASKANPVLVKVWGTLKH